MTEKTILIVDDSAFDRELVSRVFQKRFAVKVLEADGANSCYEQLERERIDLVLLDLMMPGTSGSDVLAQIRKSHNAIELPIIIVTSQSDDSDVVKCLQAGANDYIVKPINFEVAISRINTHLRFAELSREIAHIREYAAMDAMIATYNHEINNPLAIAISCVTNASTIAEIGSEHRDKLLAALWRIADIVKKTQEVTAKREVEFQQYSANAKIIKVR